MTLLGVLGVIPALAWVYWRERTFRPYRWRAALVLGAWPAILVASLALGATALYPEASAGGIDGRLLFPAIASISFILFVGVTAWFPRRYVGVVGAFLTVGMGMVAARAPAWYIAPAYAAPPRIALEQVPDTIHDLGISYGDELFLLGYELPQETVRAGENLNLRLYWLARRAMRTDYSVAIRVAGRRGERIGAIDTFHGGGNLPTRVAARRSVDRVVVPMCRCRRPWRRLPRGFYRARARALKPRRPLPPRGPRDRRCASRGRGRHSAKRNDVNWASRGAHS